MKTRIQSNSSFIYLTQVRIQEFFGRGRADSAAEHREVGLCERSEPHAAGAQLLLKGH